MEHDGKKWRLVDDPICDVENWQSVPADCRECELFYDCYEIDDDYYNNLDEEEFEPGRVYVNIMELNP